MLETVAATFPVVTLLGPRQSGKTTLVRAQFPHHYYLNFENPETRALFREDPKSILHGGSEPIIIDEAQREPDVLSWLQVFVDRDQRPGQFVVTGSNQPALGEAIAQSLAGRTSVHYLLPLSLEELSGSTDLTDRDSTLHRGFLPRLFDAHMSPHELYSAYFATYIERDVLRLINVRDMSKFETFVRLLAGRVGQLINLSSLSNDVGVSSTALAGWLSALEASFVVMRLPPYHTNLGKRLLKTPKIFFTEPGLLAWLLQIETSNQIARDPLLGAMFENMVVMEAAKAAHNRGLEPRLSFYRDKSGFEVDLIREYQRRPMAIEVKAGTTFLPEMMNSLRRFRDLHGDTAGAALVYGGAEATELYRISVTPFFDIGSILFPDLPPGATR